MANKIARQTGNWSDVNSWGSESNTHASIHTSNNTTPTTTGIFTAAFTAPSLVDAFEGIVLYVNTISTTTSTLTVTLQEDLGGGFADTAAVMTWSLSSRLAATYIRLTPAAAYTYMTTTANKYRFKIVTSTNSAMTLASDGTATWFIAQDSRTGAPVAGDDVYIVSNQTANLDITQDGASISWGSNGANSYFNYISTARAAGFAAYIASNGRFLAANTLSTTQNPKGNIGVCNGGTWDVNKVGTAYINTLLFDESALTTAQYYTFFIQGIATKVDTRGADGSPYSASYVSGAGTTASPLVVPASWNVGDQIVTESTGQTATAWNEVETKFIISKPSATTAVLSNTSGGVEAGLTYTHTTTAKIFNITRGSVITTSDATKGWYLFNWSAVPGNVDISRCRFSNNGSSGNSTTHQLCGYTLGAYYVVCDDLVIDGIISIRGAADIITNVAQTFNRLVGYNCLGAYGGTFQIESRNCTYNDMTVLKGQSVGIGGINASRNTFNRARVNGMTLNTSSTCVAMGGVNNEFIDSDFHASRGSAVQPQTPAFISTVIGVKFTNCRIGTQAVNNSTVLGSTGYYDALFTNCLFGSGTIASSYSTMNIGSKVKFQKYNQTNYYNFFYTENGKISATGAGLPDTFTFANGNRAILMEPENTSPGLKFFTKVRVKANSAGYILLKVQKNAAFGSDVLTVNFYLPGSTTPDATVNAPNDTSENTIALAASYSGSIPAYGTVEVIAKSAAVGAKAYIGNFFNGTNEITATDLWDEGEPSAIMFEQLGDAAAVWEILTSTLTTSGTVGKSVVDTNSTTNTINTNVSTINTNVNTANSTLTTVNSTTSTINTTANTIAQIVDDNQALIMARQLYLDRQL